MHIKCSPETTPGALQVNIAKLPELLQALQAKRE
jgi:hypothetical protein